MKKVLLISGHSFIDCGCSIEIDNKTITEYSLTSWVVSEIFKRERLKDIDLIIKGRNRYCDLVEEINSLNCDIIISLHFNSYDKKTQGTEVLYCATSRRGKILAVVSEKIMVKHLKLNMRGIKPTTTEMRGGMLLNKTKAPAVIIEPFFLDSIKSMEELKLYINNSIKGILEILEFISKNDI